MNFTNRENKVYQTEDGPIWASRSVAVVFVLLFKQGNELFVLTEKRSPNMDMPGTRCLVSGYMDWDETGPEAVLRETFEETGINLNQLRRTEKIIYRSDQPFRVRTDVNENRQNVALNYVELIDIGEDGHWALLEAEKFQNEEIDDVKVINVKEVPDYVWAFEHDQRIVQALEYLDNIGYYGFLQEMHKDLDNVLEMYDKQSEIHEEILKELDELRSTDN